MRATGMMDAPPPILGSSVESRGQASGGIGAAAGGTAGGVGSPASRVESVLAAQAHFYEALTGGDLNAMWAMWEGEAGASPRPSCGHEDCCPEFLGGRLRWGLSGVGHERPAYTRTPPRLELEAPYVVPTPLAPRLSGSPSEIFSSCNFSLPPRLPSLPLRQPIPHPAPTLPPSPCPAATPARPGPLPLPSPFQASFPRQPRQPNLNPPPCLPFPLSGSPSDPSVSQVVAAAGQLDPWASQLKESSRPAGMRATDCDALLFPDGCTLFPDGLFSDGDNGLFADGVAWTTTVERPAAGGTLLATQGWRWQAGGAGPEGGEWRLVVHRTIPWDAGGGTAVATLRCDCRGCVALARQINTREVAQRGG